MEDLRLRLVTEGERCYLQVAEVDEEADHWAETDPYNLLSVLSGLRYHVSAGNTLCSLHREADEIVVEYQNGNRPNRTCRVGIEHFEATVSAAARKIRRGYLA
jgi:hypothetical protein